VLEELERRNYSQATAHTYVAAIRRFAEHFHRSPDQLGCEEIRQYQLYLMEERKLRPKSVMVRPQAFATPSTPWNKSPPTALFEGNGL
jgi:hypothetical protein